MGQVKTNLYEMMGRKKMGTIQELHKKSELSRTIISELLKAEKDGETPRQIRLDTLYKLCTALDCTVGELITFEKEEVK